MTEERHFRDTFYIQKRYLKITDPDAHFGTGCKIFLHPTFRPELGVYFFLRVVLGKVRKFQKSIANRFRDIIEKP